MAADKKKSVRHHWCIKLKLDNKIHRAVCRTRKLAYKLAAVWIMKHVRGTQDEKQLVMFYLIGDGDSTIVNYWVNNSQGKSTLELRAIPAVKRSKIEASHNEMIERVMELAPRVGK